MNNYAPETAPPRRTLTWIAGMGAIVAFGALGFILPRFRGANAAGTPGSAASDAVQTGEAPSSVDFSVQASVGGAKMNFRGRTMDLPYRGDETASTTPEVVEITAPGAIGRRYWFKLDRP